MGYDFGMGLKLNEIVSVLGEIAPLELAANWDNVGLLVAPTKAKGVRRVGVVLLTIDLTEAVLAEAIHMKAGLIVAYHPPIFSGMKRVNGGSAGAIENKLAVYSPHTALDAAAGGMTDWLCAGLGQGATAPIEGAEVGGDELKVVVFVPHAAVDELRGAMSAAGAGVIGGYTECAFGLEGEGTFYGGAGTAPVVGRAGRLEKASEVRLEMVCPSGSLARVAEAIARHHPYEEPAWDVYPLAGKPRAGVGAGRVLTLDKAVTLKILVSRTKKMLGLKHVRVAGSPELKAGARLVRTVAVCPGAGGSLFEGVQADAYLTGEMRHHDVLAKVEGGGGVILTDHTNTERPYLPVLAERLHGELKGKVEVVVSKVDADPLSVV